MPLDEPSTRTGQRRPTRLVGLGSAMLLGMTAAALAVPPSASADPVTSARSGSFTITGGGFGHGLGMSQYGAYGAAVRGKTYRQILAFYYPGTTLTTKGASTIRVWVSSDTDGDVRALPASGLRVADAAGRSARLPTGSAYRAWRISRSGAGYKLSYRGSGGWRTRSTSLGTSTWRFTGAGEVRVQLPSGATRTYRGSVALVKRGSTGRTVNTVSLEDYVRAVVPVEMPTSWHGQAIRVQSVAARTYAAKLRSTAPASRGYDICDTTACQVYRGAGYETTAGTAATRATAGQILHYGSSIALTMFASSNGGWSKTGPYPYLRAAADPYDGVVRSQTWTRKISAASIARKWPSVGTVRALKITERDRHGRWGGRVLSMQVIGSRKRITVTGSAFQSRFGMRSNYFTVNGTSSASAPAAPAAPTPTPVVTTLPPGKRYAAFPRSYSATSRVDLALIGASGTLRRYPITGGRLGSATSLGTGFGRYTHVAGVGDWNGDGYGDVVARTSGRRLLLLRGTASGRLAAGVDLGLLSDHTSITGVGDANGDGRPDLMAIGTDGRAHLVYGNGRTGQSGYRAVAGSWAGADWLRGVGDFDRDGRVDVVSRRGSRLYLHRGSAVGFSAPTSLGVGTRKLRAVTAVGDVDGDGRADLLARTAAGNLRLYRGDGDHRLRAPRTVHRGIGAVRFTT